MICPICNQPTNLKKSFLPRFFYCTICTGHFLKKEKLPNYPEKYFKQKQSPSLIAKLAKSMLDFFYNQRVKTIENFVGKNNPRILDYGCGSGKLVEQLNKRRIQIKGFEPSLGALNLARRKKLPVYQSIKKIKGGYDLIMFWHSLEHIDEPFKIIKTIKKYLNSKGKILIAIPNADSFEAKIFKDRWFHWSYPIHRIQFTPKAITMLLEKNGFKIKRIDYFNPEYTLTGLLQSFLNVFAPKDVLYSVVAHRRLSIPLSQALIWSILSILLTTVSFPILLLFFLIELIFKKTGAMVIFAKNG